MVSFMDKHEKDIKKYGMMKDYNARCIYIDTVCYCTGSCLITEVKQCRGS